MAYFWIQLPTVLLSFISFFASLYICISAFMLGRLRQKQSQIDYMNRSGYHISTTSHYWETETLITHHIFWMSFCDILFSFWCIMNWSPQLIFNVYLFESPHYLCTLSGIWVTMTNLGGTLWYLVIAYCLFSIIFNIQNKCTDIASKRTQLYHSIFVWSLTIILPAIILVFDGYGQFTNINDKECGTEGRYQIIIYFVFIFTVLFAIFLLLSVLYKMYIKKCLKKLFAIKLQRKNARYLDLNYGDINDNTDISLSESFNDILSGISVNKRELILRLTEFTLVFVFVWIFPIIDRTYQWIINDADKSPQWLAICHNFSLVSVGFGNAFVWSRSKSFVSANQSKKSMAKIDYSSKLSLFAKSMGSPDTINIFNKK